MRYVYFPKLLNDLENIEQYNDLLPDNISVENVSIKQAMKSETYATNCLSYICSYAVESKDDKYACYNISPRPLNYRPRNQQHLENIDHDADFYVYSPARNNRFVCDAVHFIFKDIIHIIENACTCANMHTGVDDSPSRCNKGEAVVILLKQLVNDYDSEEAFRADISRSYPFALTEGVLAFAAINNHLDDLKKLITAIYTTPKQFNTCTLFSRCKKKLVNVLNEIDFWIDSADYDQLCAYEFLLRDEVIHDNKEFQSIVRGQQFTDYYDEVRRHIIEAKQARFKDQKISLRLDELRLAKAWPRNIKLRLQW